MSRFQVFASLCCCALVAACSSNRAALVDYSGDPAVVAVLDGEPLTLGQFESSYAKSVGGRDEAKKDTLSEYADFLERYVDFRLKVRLGEAAGLDTSSTILSEIDSYRRQFARPYLIDRKVMDPIVRDLYEKQGLAVDASHLLIRVGPEASPSDTLAAHNRISAIRDSVVAGADFGDMAFRHSEDPSAASAQQGTGYRGRLGYFTGGRMVQAFEDQAFSLDPGEMSDVFRTRFGYHLMLVHDRRDMPQDIRLSHIMLSAGGPTAEDSARALTFATDIRDSLTIGADFADLVAHHSTDSRSAGRGGDLGWIAFDSRLIEPLKSVAFGMNVGDVSDPLLSPFGIHILRLTDTRARPSFDEAYEQLKTTASRLPRTDIAEERYLRGLLDSAPQRVDTTALLEIFAGFSSDSLLQALRSSTIDSAAAVDTVVSLRTTGYTLADVSAWAADKSLEPGPYVLATILSVTDEFLVDMALEQEIDRLEDADSDFRATMQEFRDGLILFRIMEDSVWSAAASDSSALEALYRSDPSRYAYPDRTRILGFHCQGQAIADTVVSLLESDMSPDAVLAAVTDSAGSVVRLDTTLVAGTTNSVFDRALLLDDGAWTQPVSYNRGFVVLVRSGTEAARPKTLDEARAELVTQLQSNLEDNLVARLRRTYGVITYPEKLSFAFSPAAASPGGAPD